MTYPIISDYSDLATRVTTAPHSPPHTVSIITVCKNAASCIERCLTSIRKQEFQDYEHIIIDGASTDVTTNIVRKIMRPQDLLLSEHDNGISDAMNKGIVLARGRYVLFVHADDWLSKGQLQAGVAAVEATQASYVFGDLVFFIGGTPEFVYRGDPDYMRSIDRCMPALNHPTMLVRREAFEDIGLFSLKYRCAMDYDWLLRLHRAGGHGEYRPEILGCMNHDGVSNRAYWRTMQEVRDIAVSYGRNPALAECEFLYRVYKICLGRAVRMLAAPAQRRIRQRINRSYSLPTSEILSRLAK